MCTLVSKQSGLRPLHKDRTHFPINNGLEPQTTDRRRHVGAATHHSGTVSH